MGKVAEEWAERLERHPPMPEQGDYLDRYGYEQGAECRYAPDGWHRREAGGRCFWCRRRVEG